MNTTDCKKRSFYCKKKGLLCDIAKCSQKREGAECETEKKILADEVEAMYATFADMLP